MLKNQVKSMLPGTPSTFLPSKDTKKASETAYSQIRCQRCFIFSLWNSPQPLISRCFPSFPTSSRMVSRWHVLFVSYSVRLHPGYEKRCVFTPLTPLVCAIVPWNYSECQFRFPCIFLTEILLTNGFQWVEKRYQSLFMGGLAAPSFFNVQDSATWRL